MAANDCPNLKKNLESCACTYTACGVRGRCCDCLRNHLRAGELPGCCFGPEDEQTYDRSIARFMAARSK